jgi:predicted alpha/beta-hydrolase family hydrolase
MDVEPGAAPVSQPRWFPLGAACVVAVAVFFSFATAWGGIWASHPAYWITLVVLLVGATALGVWAWRTHSPTGRARWRAVVAGVAWVTGALVLTGVAVWLRPLTADDIAVQAMSSGNGVTVSTSVSMIRLDPSSPKSTGLVFYPGAKVDPRAYAHILRPIAEAGYPVAIVKFPYNLAVMSPSAADDVVGRADGIDHWVIGGHSLGGVMAARFARSDHAELAGLLLWASYPSGSMASRTGLDIVSVSGTHDGLATPADIDASKKDLPADTHFVAVEGGIHAYFGDYGAQSGDGTATISRADAQQQIIAATLAQLQRIDTGAGSSTNG